ncbi:hypothetical protein AN4541.2 [Aspergillus nidulans FGSC A4]|uniref:Nicotinamide N-methyltransferase, putative (AFU_orthologue AFUA_1G17750) n=1 Tax=Emericella nidulans (strain FGSC A4 / ATCC 38163 / CBS 112.46 / NRRL 194 / M139) TaxID=227321 RepID=Q5B4I9_EMENI|nr:hypothetical protein [Aspergillus nidulans FGSC A4]EAA60884.1 hypothetical protein AN4541.2 [Aspergillus nidulans FGSC A4]CBF77292.1 TPA: nicotinamide N-methyltransferase, putative (AFU_orthologue; AFUA_1G17750) [Aspergillus nidulans FGSC A4]|eukprot:XP_662145.1 hypothetical protein AN4541.2 [Aspergillus nidulans FGSC A4]
MSLHARLRPLPRRLATQPPSESAAPTPHFEDPPDGANAEDDAEDLFSSFLPHLFPDDAPQFHGDPGQYLLYSSPRYGELQIMVPSYPSQSQSGARSKEIAEGLPRSDGQVNQVEEGRKLFAHFLWSAAMVVAEGLEQADTESGGSEAEFWKVQNEKVLELGAGAGLPSIVSALANASMVTITDHPSSPALGPAGAIASNVKHNLSSSTSIVDIRPHEWGTTLTTDPWALSNKGSYTRIIAADCYWMRSQHENLVRTMKWFLAPEGKIWVVAGFHTGREIVAGFFETAVSLGLKIESIYERDLNSSAEEGGEVRRAWVSFREGEGPENRRRWCVVAVLGHAPAAAGTGADA